MNWTDIFLIGHVAGVVLGAGAAFTSDAIFLSSVKDGKLSSTELRFIRLSSRMVWIGIATIFVFGALLVWQDPALYLSSDKFWAKMTIVGVIVLNGLIFHLSHIPRMVRHAGEHFSSSDEFMRKRTLLVSSGAVSVVSWISAFILGSWRNVTYSYMEMMSVYLGVVIIAILVANLRKRRMIPHHKKGM